MFSFKYKCILVNPVLGLFVLEVRTGYAEMHYQDAREAFKISTVNLFAVTSVEGWLSAVDVT